MNALVHSDAMIEHWGEVFVSAGLRERLGITFEKFLEWPRYWLVVARRKLKREIEAAAERIDGDNFAPLMAEQQALADRIAAETADEVEARREAAAMTAALRRVGSGMSTAEDAALIERALNQSATGRRMLAQRNGRYFEALHHHRHPVSRADFSSRGGAA